MQFHRKVAVYESTTDRVNFDAIREVAARLVSSGRAHIAQSQRNGVITAIRLNTQPVDASLLSDARPGSFGIRREHMPSGAVVYGHHRTQDAILGQRAGFSIPVTG
jgi:hypothetical protein